MGSNFLGRLITFMQESKISFETLSLSYVISVIFAIVFFTLRFVIRNSRLEQSVEGQNGKTRIQMGIEMFCEDFLQPYINNQLTEDSKEVKKHFQYCNLLRGRIANNNIRDDSFKIRNIKLHMSKTYWMAAVHVIIEKMIGEKIPADSKNLDMEIVIRIQNAMGELYNCNQNTGELYNFYYDSGKWHNVSSHIIIGMFFSLYYYAVIISVMGATSLSIFLVVIGIIFLFIFRKRISSIYISTADLFMSVPYMVGFLVLTEVLQHFGLVPVLIAP